MVKCASCRVAGLVLILRLSLALVRPQCTERLPALIAATRLAGMAPGHQRQHINMSSIMA